MQQQAQPSRFLLQPAPPRITLGTRRWIFGLAAALCLTPWITPPLALALGMGLALALEHPAADLGKRAAKLLLQACVVLLGFGMNLAQVLRTGRDGLLVAAGTITGTLLLGWLAGRWLRVHPQTSVLISAGTAICGGSAIAAVGAVTAAGQAEMTVAMGTVFLLNAVALYLFPVLGHALHLTGAQFGMWAGIAIHDVSSVVGAATAYGAGSLPVATAVKLARALWIVPVAAGAALLFRAPKEPAAANALSEKPAPRKAQIPWFIGLFLLAAAVRSALPGAIAPSLAHLGTVGLTVTLFLIGAGISRKTLQAVGWKPLAQGALLWLCISAASLLIVTRFVAA